MGNMKNIPAGKAGLLLLAVAVVPIIWKKVRPVVNRVGEGVSKAGEALMKATKAPHKGPKTEKVDD